jgi:glycosyltransferase involved in cell wall biosynthesis
VRIAIISDWFSESMGYVENCLPKALASLGHDVHVITTDAQVYFDSPDYAATYEPFIGPRVVPTGVKTLDGYTLRRLPHSRWRGRLRISGLYGELKAIRPDVVQALEVCNMSTLEAALAQPRLRYKLFLESHVHASVFGGDWRLASRRRRLRRAAYRDIVGAFISGRAVKCYPISEDAAEIAVGLYGMAQSKIEVCSLGVDTELFRPPESQEEIVARDELRARLGFRDEDIVCIYTGRFSPSKGPQVLADAIALRVAAGDPFRGVFVGGGTEAEARALRNSAGCQVVPFVPARDLPPYYWAADIGVWPRQESTSQLDAAAAGLPIILSDRVTVLERVTGNGLTYREGDPADLAERIKSLAPAALRRQLGTAGSGKMRAGFSWGQIAEKRAADYAGSLSARRIQDASGPGREIPQKHR